MFGWIHLGFRNWGSGLNDNTFSRKARLKIEISALQSKHHLFFSNLVAMEELQQRNSAHRLVNNIPRILINVLHLNWEEKD